MKDTKNKKVLEKASDIPRVQVPKKVVIKKKKDHHDQVLKSLNEKLPSSTETGSFKVLEKVVSETESDEKSMLESTNRVENESSLKIFYLRNFPI